MIAIQNIAGLQNTGVSTNFVLTTIEVIDASTLRVWFSRGTTNANVASNYSFYNSTASIPVTAAQYETEIINNEQATPLCGVRLYLNSPIPSGQWTLSVLSVTGLIGSVVSNDSNAFGLSSVDTPSLFVIDFIDRSSQIDTSTTSAAPVVPNFVPQKFRNLPIFSSILAGYEAGDEIIRDQARFAFDQYFISTATGDYLTTRIKDQGVAKPSNLGIQDDTFRQLAINIINSKITDDALYNILEIMYGPESVRGYVESTTTGPFEMLDTGTLSICVDGSTNFLFIASSNDYAVPLRATAQEVVSAFNFAFDKNSINAYTEEENSGSIRIYSNTKGSRSSITITGGTLQPSLQFNTSVFSLDYFLTQTSNHWTISNPSPGIVRFQLTDNSLNFVNPVLKIGDYVSIIGSEFPTALRGSYPIVNINYSFSGSTAIQYFDITSSFMAT